MLQKINGIVLKTQAYGETNKIVTIFSEEIGKITGVARGANRTRSRMAAVTQPFIHGNYLVYVNRGLSSIQQGEVSHSFRKIREDIVKTAYAAYIAELVDKLVESRKPNDYLYYQFYRTMEWIDKEVEYEIPVLMFELKVYKEAGFSPHIHACVLCKQEQDLTAFSIHEGGLICKSCFSKSSDALVLPNGFARLLRIFLEVGLERIGNISIQEKNKVFLRNLFDAYYDQYGGYQIKSRNFLRQMDQLE